MANNTKRVLAVRGVAKCRPHVHARQPPLHHEPSESVKTQVHCRHLGMHCFFAVQEAYRLFYQVRMFFFLLQIFPLSLEMFGVHGFNHQF